ncbi:acyl-homoserine-lactone synthase [Pelagovum pacificum]|uniref:Acyl-homoserine-lactone synthase n=1 Tax=Pelagovum pacificum TaxID=2588711 RepID=A0A5C5GA11_9RHOB|nr:acyl-homoserine-lactone synthase [Pelagovum pacificum]QQA42428.1 autoinducer synthase [Pelagovum pacificum]TNY31511.1 autoinducer synthase [Pelagovum pacificum]
MLRYIYGHELDWFPLLRDTMFRDRAAQFADRLGWDVSVDAQGHERDEYDDLNPLYVIREQSDGRHGGSMRFLPTTGRTMVNEHFIHLSEGVEIRSPLIWECTRFCLSATADGKVAAGLMAACGEIMKGFGLTHLVGVFDARMVRIYRLIGAPPEVLGSDGVGVERISVGLWAHEQANPDRVFRRAGLSPQQSKSWFDASFGPIRPAEVVAA